MRAASPAARVVRSEYAKLRSERATLGSGNRMQHYLAALTIVLLLGMVLARVAMLRRQGVRAMNFGKQDKTDFLIPPFAFFYFYLVFADAFGWPTVSRQTFFASGAAAWLGVALCLTGLLFLFWSLVSFGRSFRVGIDDENPDKLVTGGVFAWSRNPIYVAFWLILAGSVPGVPELAAVGLSRRRDLAVPPPGQARGSVPRPTLRRGVRGLLRAGAAVSVGAQAKPAATRRAVLATHRVRRPGSDQVRTPGRINLVR